MARTKQSVVFVLLLLALCGTATAQTTRGFLSVNGGILSGSNAARQSRTFDNALFGSERGRVEGTFPDGGGTVFDVTGGVKLWRGLAIGAGVSRYSRTEDVSVTARLPHPFFFGRPRTVSGTLRAQERNETAIHLQAMWVAPLGRRVEIAVFGGPSIFNVSQDLLTRVRFDQQYPYDSATLTDIRDKSATAFAAGFHVGTDAGVYFTRWIGLGGTVRFTRATARLDGVKVEAGGLLTSAGLRVRF